MRGLVLALFMLLGIGKGFGQKEITPQFVDSMSFHFYNLKKWDDLIRIGEKGVAKGYGNYYLNIRLAIAYFEKRLFYKAIYYAKRAADYKEGNNDFANEYIYWSYVLLGQEFLANEVYIKLENKTKNRIKNQSFRPIEWVGLNTGLGKSQFYTKNMKIIGVEAGQKLSHRLKTNYAFNYLGYKKEWGGLVQKNVYAGLAYYLGKGFSLQLGFSTTWMKSDITLFSEENYIVAEETEINNVTYYDTVNYEEKVGAKGSANERLTTYNLGASYVKDRWWFGTNICGLYSKKRLPLEETHSLVWKGVSVSETGDSYSLKGDTVYNFSYNLDDYFSQFVWGFSTSYQLSVWNDRLTPGLDAYLTIREGIVSLPFSPNLTLRVSKNLWTYFSYVEKGNYYLVENNAKAITNYLDKINSRITLSGSYFIGGNWQLKGTVLIENRTESYTNEEQNYLTFLLGIQLKL